MEGLIYIILIAGVIASIAAAVKSMKAVSDTMGDRKVWKEEKERGNLAFRNTRIWEEEERFFTNATYEMVTEKINAIDTSHMKVKVTADYEGENLLVFEGNGFVATLEYVGENEGKNEFTFCYPAYKTPVGTYLPAMNYCLTITEKAFLELDPATATETHALKYKTNRKWTL